MTQPDPKIEDIELRLLLEAIQQRYHYDFRDYAMASIKRRIMQARDRLGCGSLSILQDRVLRDPALMPQLLGFLTIQVSELFRDPSFFLALRTKVLPHLRTYPSIKVWVAGCSEGEELYSLAILFREEGLEGRVIFYATDINSEALRKAEAGVYPLDRIALYTRNHQLSGGTTSLSDYYTAGYGAAVFDKRLRQRAVFANHNLASDFVFAEVHLVCCRNVLIYFNRQLQDRALGLFEEALVRKGFLGLGSKESLRFSSHVKSFEAWAREERIYQKQGGPGTAGEPGSAVCE